MMCRITPLHSSCKSTRFFFSLFLFLLFFFSGSPAFARPLLLFTSIPPLKHFIEAVGKEQVQVRLLEEKGYDPHRFEPKGQTVVQLEKADGYISVGLSFEKLWLKKFQALFPRLVLIETDKAVEKIEGDPHIWLSPPLVKQIITNISHGLQGLDPAHAKTYAENAERYQEKIDALDKEIRSKFASSGKADKAIFLYHPFLRYYAKHYHLVQLGVEQEGKTVKPKELIKLIERAKALHITKVFTEPGISLKVAKSVAASIDAKLVLLNPLEEKWEENMRILTKQILLSFGEPVE